MGEDLSSVAGLHLDRHFHRARYNYGPVISNIVSGVMPVRQSRHNARRLTASKQSTILNLIQRFILFAVTLGVKTAPIV